MTRTAPKRPISRRMLAAALTSAHADVKQLGDILADVADPAAKDPVGPLAAILTKHGVKLHAAG